MWDLSVKRFGLSLSDTVRDYGFCQQQTNSYLTSLMSCEGQTWQSVIQTKMQTFSMRGYGYQIGWNMQYQATNHFL